MTNPDGRELPPTAAGSPAASSPAEAPSPLRICHYLMAAEGWRSSTAASEHRCTAVEPPAHLTTEKQRRLCLTADHLACATFVAAGQSRAADAPAAGGHLGRPIARTAPVVLERSRPLVPAALLSGTRRWSQAGLVVLMLVALIAIVISRSGGSSGSIAGGAGASASSTAGAPSSAETPKPSTEPSIEATGGSPSGSPVGSAPTATLRPTATPRLSPSASPAASRTYTVKRGDTLSSIAVRFGTSVRAIQELNGIANPSIIRVGQVLQIP